MNPDSPMSQMVVWVPSSLAATWEHLPPERQTALTTALVQWLTSRMLIPPATSTLRQMVDLQKLTVAELRTFVTDLEQKYGKRSGGE